MRSTVSHKETGTHTERCDQCGLWFEFLHLGASGRSLCRLCLELAGENRTTGGDGLLGLGRERYLRPIAPILQPVTIEYQPPDPDGRPHVWFHFETGPGYPTEADLGDSIGCARSVEKQQLELSEGLALVLFEDEGDEWMFIDAIVDRPNPQSYYPVSGWIVRLDWSTFRRMPKPSRYPLLPFHLRE
jgi:hypothetical protein